MALSHVIAEPLSIFNGYLCSLISRIHTGAGRHVQSRRMATDPLLCNAITTTDIFNDVPSHFKHQLDPFAINAEEIDDAIRALALTNAHLKIRKPTFQFGSTRLSFDVYSGMLHVQKRGFRSTTFSAGQGVGKKKVKADEKFSLGRIFGIKKTKKTKDESLDEEQMREKLNKMVENERIPYMLGTFRTLSGRQLKTSPWRVLNWSIFLLIVSLVFAYSDLRNRFYSSLFITDLQEIEPEEINVSFRDVRGVEDAKSELEEIVTYLRHPERYSQLGGKLPKGVLLVGPPGTGKTLLARAIAGEAQVPFFYASGSSFDEILVGQGARKVRQLFATAKQKTPCLIFIDELDSVGSKRVTSNVHPYANQTVNQLLTEMDGFRNNDGLIIIGATNLVDNLDKALLRQGRFDVQVNLTIPDLKARRELFDLYLNQVVTGDDLDANKLSKKTIGFTGADIQGMVNQAALKAATDGHSYVPMEYFEEARDRVIMGPKRRQGRLPDNDTNRITAYHEAGHALVTVYTKESTPLDKVTIIPRGQSLGYTAMIEHKDVYNLSRSKLLASIDCAMGGRIAEELIFGVDNVTTGVVSDMHNASAIASRIVKEYSMSDKVGLRNWTEWSFDPSQATKEVVDQEIKQLLHESYERAKELIQKHQKELVRLAEALFEHETLNAEEVRLVIDGKCLDREKYTDKMDRSKSVAAAFI